MIKGTTATGFEFELEDGALDDYELLELLNKIDNGETKLITEMVDKFLGSEQKERLKEHVRDNSGRVSAKKLIAEVMEIFKANSEGKN